MDQFWNHAVEICGLSAVVSLVFLALFRQFLRLSVFKQMTEKQTFVLLLVSVILVFCFSLAGFGTYIVTRENAGSAPVQTTTQEALDAFDSKEKDGLVILDEKRDHAPTPQAAQAAAKAAEVYRHGMDDIRDALKKGQINRATDALRDLIQKLHQPYINDVFPPGELDNFIHIDASIPKEDSLDPDQRRFRLNDLPHTVGPT